MVKGIKKNDYDYNDSFIDDDDDDDLVFNTRKRKNSDLEDDKFRKFSKMFYKKKINEIDKTSRDRDLIIDDIIDLELSNEDNVWFYDHINVRDYIEDDEQRLKINNTEKKQKTLKYCLRNWRPRVSFECGFRT